MARTPAEQLDWLVQQGADRFVETFLKTMQYMSEGGRTPGLVIPSKQELQKFYKNTTDAYWQTLAQADPQGAQDQIAQWKAAGG